MVLSVAQAFSDIPQNEGSKLKRERSIRLMKRGLLLTAVATFLFIFAFRIEQLSYDKYLRDVELDTTLSLIEMREHVAGKIFSHLLDMNELAVYVGQNTEINETQFNIKAVDYILKYPSVRAVALAPDLKVTMIFPRHGNEGAIGLDYRKNEQQFGRVKEAMDTGNALITGPVDLMQGGRGLILRKPIVTQERGGLTSQWGILSIVLDYERFLAAMGVPEFDETYDLAIYETDPETGKPSEILIGTPEVLGSDPMTLDLNLPFGTWKIAASPNGGWPVSRPAAPEDWAIRISFILICLGALSYVLALIERQRIAERQLSVGIEALDHGFVMFDPDRRLVAFNKKYKELAGGSGMVRIGARYEDIVKANLKKGLIPDAVGREEEWYEEWSRRLDFKAADKEQVLADGSLIRAYDRPMADGSVVGLRIDITDLKKAQIAAEAANKAKTDFMGVLSHELRTPLTVILGNAQLAKNMRNMPAYRKLVSEIDSHPEVRDQVLPKLDAMSGQVTKMMEALERSGNHLLTLISEILDFAKIDSGTLTMEMAKVDSQSIIDTVIDQMRPLVESKGLKLDVSSASFALRGDQKRLQQVLINLIGNATKFTDSGTISVSVREEDDTITFDVADTGIGIPEEHLNKVFEAFHQVDSTSGRKYGGTGLGLAISRDIARAHGGELTAVSEPGKGSVFTLRLPKSPLLAPRHDSDDCPDSMVA